MKLTKAGICRIVGTILVLIAGIMPFYSVEFFGMKETVNLFKPDGIGIAILWLVFAIASVVVGLLGKEMIANILAILAGAGMLLSFFSNAKDLKDLGELGDLINKGLGYWLALISGIIMILAGVLGFILKEDAE